MTTELEGLRRRRAELEAALAELARQEQDAQAAELRQRAAEALQAVAVQLAEAERLDSEERARKEAELAALLQRREELVAEHERWQGALTKAWEKLVRARDSFVKTAEAGPQVGELNEGLRRLNGGQPHPQELHWRRPVHPIALRRAKALPASPFEED